MASDSPKLGPAVICSRNGTPSAAGVTVASMLCCVPTMFVSTSGVSESAVAAANQRMVAVA